MGNNVIVSFEGDIVKVAYISKKGKKLVVDDALTFNNEDFDDFLAKEKAKEFIVVNNFRDAFQDIFLIPPVKKKYAKNLIENEIKQKSPFDEFTYIYRIIGEKLEGNRTLQEISVYVVKTESLTQITERFIDKSKIVKAIYPHIYSVASEVPFDEESVLCVSEVGHNRILFLLKDGKVEFVRAVQASEKGIGDSDIQSINVTVNYCKQVLKTSPTGIVLIGDLSQHFTATVDIDIPIISPLKPKNVKVQNDVYSDFVYPISALGVSKESNISPKDYSGFYSTWKMLKYSAAAFILLSIAGLLYSGYSLVNVFNEKGKLDSLKKEIAGYDVNALNVYNKRKSEFETYKGFVESSGKTVSMPILKNFLTSFSDANTEKVSIEDISMRIEGEVLKTSIKGEVNETFDDEEGGLMKYTHYQEFIDSLTGLKGIAVKKHALVPKKRDFTIELESR